MFIEKENKNSLLKANLQLEETHNRTMKQQNKKAFCETKWAKKKKGNQPNQS